MGRGSNVETGARKGHSSALAVDYDLWLRMGRRCDPLVADRVRSAYRIHNESKTGHFTPERLREHCAVARRHAQAYPWRLVMNRPHAEKAIWAYA